MDIDNAFRSVIQHLPAVQLYGDEVSRPYVDFARGFLYGLFDSGQALGGSAKNLFPVFA